MKIKKTKERARHFDELKGALEILCNHLETLQQDTLKIIKMFQDIVFEEPKAMVLNAIFHLKSELEKGTEWLPSQKALVTRFFYYKIPI